MTLEAETAADSSPAMPDEQRPSRSPLAPVARFFRRNLPRGLFARSLLIIVLPMLILQTVLVFVFMERHWQMVTNRLSAAVTRDIASIIDLLDRMPAQQDDIIRIAEERMGLTVKVLPDDKLPPRKPIPFCRARSTARSTGRSGSIPASAPSRSRSASSSTAGAS
jgi:two-component system osmolarity sensor histidine kinase EnvZ